MERNVQHLIVSGLQYLLKKGTLSEFHGVFVYLWTFTDSSRAVVI